MAIQLTGHSAQPSRERAKAFGQLAGAPLAVFGATINLPTSTRRGPDGQLPTVGDAIGKGLEDFGRWLGILSSEVNVYVDPNLETDGGGPPAGGSSTSGSVDVTVDDGGVRDNSNPEHTHVPD